MIHRTRSNPQHYSHNREHWTRKKGQWKEKVSYPTQDDALLVLKRGILKEGYTVYQCTQCSLWHIGYDKNYPKN